MNWKDISAKVVQALVVASLLWLAGGIKDLVLEVKELRYDVDRLYAEVSDLAERVQ